MIIKSVLSQIIESQQSALRKRDKGFTREALTVFSSYVSHALIVSGIRRCGKSTLLAQLLLSKYPKAFYLNFDDPRLFDFDKNDWMRLDEIISASGSRALFFDEIQIINEWERYIRQKLDEQYRIFITGSNASLLSRELGTKLTGRHISRELFPFSYAEFISFKKIKPSRDSITVYMKTGGFPEFVKTRDTEVLNHFFQDILIRDIAVRYSLRDLKTLQRMALYLISNIGRLITATKLKKQFSVGSTTTVMEYLSYFEMSYLLFFVPKFSYSLKVQNVNPRKVYSIDTGLAWVNSASFTDDLGALFENTVFLHLRRKYNELYYFSEKNECDFVACKNEKVLELVQACYVLNNDNLERETNGLFEAMDFFKLKKATIVTHGQSDLLKNKNETINVVPAHEFLLK
ncbi:MAG: ATP-binding protein [Bacteroidia bacterium]|nr:ATP-binding protein [Bacteroidia bacterium]